MTPGSEAVLAQLRALAAGLPLGDVARLLERVAQADAADELRAALMLLGAAALLGEVQGRPDPRAGLGGQLARRN